MPLNKETKPKYLKFVFLNNLIILGFDLSSI